MTKALSVFIFFLFAWGRLFILLAAGVGFLIYFIYKNSLFFKKNGKGKALESITKDSETIIYIKHMGAEVSLNTKDILFVKSAGNYLEFHTETRMYLARQGMKNFLKNVEPDSFVRVHRSYSVRLDKVDKKNSQKIWIQDHEIPIGRVHKNQINEHKI